VRVVAASLMAAGVVLSLGVAPALAGLKQDLQKLRFCPY
jgi:hypothetical protein